MNWRFQRFPTVSASVAVLCRVAAVILGLVVSGLVLAFAGKSPFYLGAQVISSTFGSAFGLQDLGLLVAPLILTGAAVAVTLQIGVWNIGGEGQFYAGAFAATAVGVFIPGPHIVMIPAMFIAGAIGGMIWILIPTLARAYADVNELITTLLLNFVAVLLVYYVATGPWRDKKASIIASTARIPHEIPSFYGIVHWGFPIAIIVTVILAAVLAYTRWGYEVRISGSNPQASRYAGIPVRQRIIAVMLISGGIAGIAGMLEVVGTVHRLQGGISNNFGYLGIMVAVIARGSLIGVMAGAVLMGVILNSGIILQTEGLNTSTVLAITGLILLFTAIGDELSHYRLVRTERAPA